MEELPGLRFSDEDQLYSLDLVRKTFGTLPHFLELHIQMVDVSRGSCTAKIEPSPRLVGNPDTGAVHGGVISTLLDSIGGAAAFTCVRKDQTVATLDLRIDYLRMSEPDRTIFGRAQCYRLSRNVAFVKGSAYCEGEEPMAHCAATFMVGSAGFSLS